MKPSLLFTLCLSAAVLPVAGLSAQTAAAPAASPAATSAPAPALDFGDFTSVTLTGKAWKAFEAKDYASVEGYTKKCIDSFKDQAIAQQKALTAPLTDKEQIFAQWALNDVGTCYFILGQALDAEGKKKEALEAYKFLVANLSFAQCYDPKGWFWKPASAAAEKVKALEFDSL